MTKRDVLIVDDDHDAALSLRRALVASGLEADLHYATSAAEALDRALQYDPHVVVLDLCIEKSAGIESGFSLLRQFLTRLSSCRIIILTGHGGTDQGIRALQQGAAHFLEKPAEVTHLAALIRDALAQSQLRRAYTALIETTKQRFSNIILGRSEKMRRVVEELQYVSQTNQAVLLCGETGTGKGICALAIHNESSRSARNFVRHQPNFSTADLANSELFGHVRGAFTGALSERRGLLAEAHGGTLFLDEIDELSIETQVTLLGVLQERKFRQIGANREQSVDFRLICASNREMKRCLASGKMRSDFYHRIAHCVITIPALRERREDIDILVEHVLLKLGERERGATLEITQDARDRLRYYDWPGNVRELEGVVEGAAHRAQYFGRRHIIATDIHLGMHTLQGFQPVRFHDKVEEFKLRLIKDSLARYDGNQIKAARDLNLDRSTLRRILARADNES